MKPIVLTVLVLGAAAAAIRRFGPSFGQSAHEKCMEMYRRNFAASPSREPSESPCPCHSAEGSPPEAQPELSPCGSA